MIDKLSNRPVTAIQTGDAPQILVTGPDRRRSGEPAESRIVTPRSEAALLGLGRMGQAVAERLLDSGHRLTVWNRSPEASARLSHRGARPVVGFPAPPQARAMRLKSTRTAAARHLVMGSPPGPGPLSVALLVRNSSGVGLQDRSDQDAIPRPIPRRLRGRQLTTARLPDNRQCRL